MILQNNLNMLFENYGSIIVCFPYQLFKKNSIYCSFSRFLYEVRIQKTDHNVCWLAETRIAWDSVSSSFSNLSRFVAFRITICWVGNGILQFFLTCFEPV